MNRQDMLAGMLISEAVFTPITVGIGVFGLVEGPWWVKLAGGIAIVADGILIGVTAHQYKKAE